MKDHESRRRFLSKGAMALAGVPFLPQAITAGKIKHEKAKSSFRSPVKGRSQGIRFAAIGLNHGHIYGQVQAMLEAGGELVSFYAIEPDLIERFQKRFPDAKLASEEAEILEDSSIQLVVSASIPVERAPLGIRVMQHGKDFMADKPGITTLEQLEEVKKVQQETGRIYSIMYSERLRNKATVHAGDLVQSGAIGQVIQTIGLGPHRMRAHTRPDWFWDKKNFGGILTDIGSHQCDQFLYFTGSTDARVTGAQIANVANKEYDHFDDFGDMNVLGNQGTGYIRIDWFTPDGLDTWGDGRLTILGTEGYIELRKYTDLAGREGGNHLFLVNQNDTRYIDCSEVTLPYGEQLTQDILNRTETAMTQDHCFLATELALKGQAMARKITFEENW